MRTVENTFGEVSVYAMIPEKGSERVVYLLEPIKNMPGLEDYVEQERCSIVSVFGMDWERDLTPWPAPKVLKRGSDFSGKAEAFLDSLKKEILPWTEKESIPEGCVPRRDIVGISLAGLFSLWSAFQSGCPFSGIASVSGSLWFDGFMDYLEKTSFPVSPEGVYLSVGDTEKNTRNPRMAVVEDNTREAARIIESRGIHVKMELNPGNHFSDTIPRLRKAIDFLLDL